ncbi:MAG: vWA domain-containing protein [Candidatus Hodarchaeales archaeon]
MSKKTIQQEQQEEQGISFHELKRETEQRLSNARVNITIFHSFFGYLLAGLEFIPKDILGLTMATDGYMVIYSPRYAKSLTNEELEFVLCHEVLHCALEHMIRRKERNQIIWNIAVDIVTNEILVQNKIGKQPKNTVRGTNFLPIEYFEKRGLMNKSAEEVYRELITRVKKITVQIGGEGSPNFDQHHDPDEQRIAGSKSETEEKQRTESKIADVFRGTKKSEVDWSARLSQAAVFAKSRGKLPTGIEEEYELTVKGYFPWQRLLASYIQQSLAHDMTFTRPNRRFVSRDLYFPAVEKSGLNVVVAIDTSGSINDEEARVFLGETFAILGQFPRINIIVIQCDATVQDVQTYSNWDAPPAKLKIKGRGGTDFRPVFEHVEKNRIQLDVLIYLTDGYGMFPEKQPYLLPVFWVLTQRDVNPPFGRKIFFPPLS